MSQPSTVPRYVTEPLIVSPPCVENVAGTLDSTPMHGEYHAYVQDAKEELKAWVPTPTAFDAPRKVGLIGIWPSIPTKDQTLSNSSGEVANSGTCHVPLIAVTAPAVGLLTSAATS